MSERRPRPSADEESVPSWVLISVLFSTVPLGDKLARALYQTACDLHRTSSDAAEVDCDLAYGRLRNLRKSALLGTIGGPTFEADLETERGKGKVRFIVTREGLALGSKPDVDRAKLN